MSIIPNKLSGHGRIAQLVVRPFGLGSGKHYATSREDTYANFNPIPSRWRAFSQKHNVDCSRGTPSPQDNEGRHHAGRGTESPFYGGLPTRRRPYLTSA